MKQRFTPEERKALQEKRAFKRFEKDVKQGKQSKDEKRMLKNERIIF